jgi:hypothetical protein
MSNIHLHIIGSDSFTKLIRELDLNYVISSDSNTQYNIHDFLIRIIFVEKFINPVKKFIFTKLN